MPVIYIPHGGGPLPLMDDPVHSLLTHALRELPRRLLKPEAIVLISAHWEATRPTVQSIEKPAMLYDYYGFPAETYEYSYPAPGSPTLAGHIVKLLESADIEADVETERGFDHGCFVPLMLMYPDADIPVVQLSLCDSLSPAQHIATGEAIAPLLDKELLVIGSGSSFHNMNFQPGAESLARAQQFDDWLNRELLDAGQTPEALRASMLGWEAAPEARFAHPREEHLLPLHVCVGIGLARGWRPGCLFEGPVFPVSVSGFLWDQ